MLLYPDFRRLWVARAVSFMGDGIGLIVLVLYVKSELDSGVAVAALLLAQTLPRLLGPFAGAVVDRVERRSVMVSCDLGQAAVFALIAIARPSLVPVLVMVSGGSLLATMFGPANRSALHCFWACRRFPHRRSARNALDFSPRRRAGLSFVRCHAVARAVVVTLVSRSCLRGPGQRCLGLLGSR